MKDRDDVPVMLLGLKRDLRVEKEGVIYPQEVSLFVCFVADRCVRQRERVEFGY